MDEGLHNATDEFATNKNSLDLKRAAVALGARVSTVNPGKLVYNLIDRYSPEINLTELQSQILSGLSAKMPSLNQDHPLLLEEISKEKLAVLYKNRTDLHRSEGSETATLSAIEHSLQVWLKHIEYFSTVMPNQNELQRAIKKVEEILTGQWSRQLEGSILSEE